ncbi:MAG: ATP-binding protein [Elusimicrobiales bacterium]
MKLTTRCFLIMMAITVLPLSSVAVWHFRQHNSIAVCALLAAAIVIVPLCMLLLISNRIIRPINNMVTGVKRFLKEDHHLAAVIPQEGWPEIRTLTGALNRLMLELQAYRAFHLNQVVEEKNKAQALIDTITDGVILSDDRGGVIYANQTALRLLGIAKIAAGVSLPRSITNESFFREFSAIMGSQEKLIRSEILVPLAAEPGAEPVMRHYRVVANQFQLATLKRPGRVVTLRDITSEKELEKAKEDFFHMITHDMRAPLSTIQGYIEILTGQVSRSSDTDRYFKNMLYSTRRLKGMIDDILNTTKLQRGTMMLALETLSANDLINRIIENNELVATAKHIRMAAALPPENLQFRGDAALLERVLTNLTGNSLKFTPTGGTITLGAAQDAANTTFWVQDTGPGIPEGKCAAIFDKYSQLEEHKSQGFGLGLAMCKMTVELHGGRIWVESEAGKGSKFAFTVAGTPAPLKKRL